MCRVCVWGAGGRSEKEKPPLPVPRRALGAPGLRAELVCNVLKASR